jgi:hypothetical protein
MNLKRDEGTVIAENPEDVANLLNNFFFSMFNKPLSQEDYDAHPVSTTTFCDPISDINISLDDVQRALLSLSLSLSLDDNNKLLVQTKFRQSCLDVVLHTFPHPLLISSIEA